MPALISRWLGRELPARRAILCPFYDGQGELIDHGLALYFPAPHSYTGEAVLELQGHGNPILQFGTLIVGLSALEPAGHYALKLTFADGPDSGLFTWDYLEQLCLRQEQLWAEYLDELHKAGKSRDPAESVVKLML